MRLHLLFLLLAFSFFGFSQEEQGSIYFPQEQVIHPDCKESNNPNNCLRQKISAQLVLIFNKAVKQNKITRDTITAQVVFEVDKNGNLVDGRHFTFVNDTVLKSNYKNDLKAITKNLPKMEVSNKKPKPYISSHKLYYSFLVDKSNTTTKLIPIKQTDKPYTGGVIDEVPQFPGCKRGDDKRARICFQKRMQKHIAKNFRYPQDAQAQGLQGRVSIMFIIGKDGDVSNLKVKGPHPILEKEATRIIKLLPKFGPGLQNGTPVRIPYSIPITFRLQ